MYENRRNRFDKSKLNQRLIPPVTEVSFVPHAEYKENTFRSQKNWQPLYIVVFTYGNLYMR